MDAPNYQHKSTAPHAGLCSGPYPPTGEPRTARSMGKTRSMGQDMGQGQTVS
jgi:hypothetical protein